MQTNQPNPRIRVADYIFRALADAGVRHVFLVTGGGAMHLNDALAREPRIRYICNHHEQASAIAAEGYARIHNQLGVVSVTSGPGGVNALNGVFGAWTDSIPMLVISGQMKRETLLHTHGLSGKLRQLGDQEVEIIPMVKGITKYAQLIDDPESVRYHLERAIHLAQSGRPGPCWLDVPVDVQAALIDPSILKAYNATEDAGSAARSVIESDAKTVLQLLAKAERPVFVAGSGVRLSGAVPAFRRLARRLGIPVTTAWTHDLIASDDPVFCGRQGTIGTRAGNFTVQNADLVIILGSRMCIRQISYNWQSFARHAHTIQIDIDPAELEKPTFKAHTRIVADAKALVEAMDAQLPTSYTPPPAHTEWLVWAKARLVHFPSVLPHQRTAPEGTINQYHFVELLFQRSGDTDIFACGDATACITPFQAGHLREGQRLFSNSGSASMGYDLPAAIGAAIAAPDRRIICLAGDGSLQMNIQELATVARHGLNIKLFVLNNGGYLSIRSTQGNFFKMLIGEGPDSGVSFPDYRAVGAAYGLASHTLDTARAGEDLERILAEPGPSLTVVELDRNQSFEPKLSSKRLADGRMVTAPLEDMAPFLDREVFRNSMMVPLQPE